MSESIILEGAIQNPLSVLSVSSVVKNKKKITTELTESTESHLGPFFED